MKSEDSKMDTRALVLVAGLILSGCETLNGLDIGPPRLEDFPKAELSFRLQGPQNAVRQYMVEYLSNRSLPYVVEIRTPETYVITAWVEEPQGTLSRRVQKTAYRLGLGSQTERVPCLPVSVVWLTKSRGVREETWSIQAADTKSPPPSWEQIKKMLTERRCK
jgi:hypothetical protein